jgi:toxin ParE1/3/4
MIVRYHSSARQEIIDITRYYARVRRELGEEFGTALDAAISTVASDPLRLEQVRPGIRRILLKRFPYGVTRRRNDLHHRGEASSSTPRVGNETSLNP